MPRGYSYDHFQVPKREPRERATPSDTLKAATAHKGESLPLPESQEGLHYGRKNAETLRRLKTRAQQRQTQGTRKSATTKKAPARGVKTLGRVAAAAKKGIQRVAKKATVRKSSKKR